MKKVKNKSKVILITSNYLKYFRLSENLRFFSYWFSYFWISLDLDFLDLGSSFYLILDLGS